VAYVNTNGDSYYMGSMDLSLCEADVTASHVSDAQSECQSLVDKTDTNEQTHTCACSCVQLLESCDTN
jgi:hypothetical protein